MCHVSHGHLSQRTKLKAGRENNLAGDSWEEKSQEKQTRTSRISDSVCFSPGELCEHFLLNLCLILVCDGPSDSVTSVKAVHKL